MVVSSLVFGFSAIAHVLAQIAVGEPIGAETADQFVQYGLLRQVKGVVGIGGYFMAWWVLLLLITGPLALINMVFWGQLARVFPRLEKSGWNLVLGTLAFSAIGTFIQTGLIEYPVVFVDPFSVFSLSPYLVMVFLAFWCGMFLPRLLVRRLALGVFLREAV